MARQKKFREQKRWLRSILVRLGQPLDWTSHGAPYDDIWFCDRLVVDGRKMRAKTRKIYLQAVFSFMEKNLKSQPEGTRLVFLLREDNLLSSRAVLFFDQDYRERFWQREDWRLQDKLVTAFLGCPLPPTVPARLLMERSGKTSTRLLVLG